MDAEEAVMAGKDLDLDILPAIAAGYRHGYSMTTRAGTVPHAVTRVPLRVAGRVQSEGNDERRKNRSHTLPSHVIPPHKCSVGNSCKERSLSWYSNRILVAQALA